MIDWAKAQAALTRAGFPCGKPDGADGPMTYTALLAFTAARQPDATIQALGRAAGNWIKGDAIAQTPQRLAEFFAQCANETGGFVRFEENLNYSALGLAVTWPARYGIKQADGTLKPNARALGLARNPEAVGNYTYGLRMGNLDQAHDTDTSPDGWQYRGRGMLQLTGRANYARFGQLLGLDLVNHPDLAADPADSLIIAREFWRLGNVNAAIDAGDFAGARRITNVGSRYARDKKTGLLIAPIGLDAVAARRPRLLTILS